MSEMLLTNPVFLEKKFTSKKFKQMSNDDKDVLLNLESIRAELNSTYKSFDYATDPVLIDSFIYQIKALNMKYQFYLELCKQKGLISDIFS